MKNQITALWDGRRILAIRGSESPFVFIWVDDVAAAMVRAATDGPAGIYNVAGDGRLTVHEIAARLGKPLLTVPAGVLGFALRIGRMLRLTVHGPEQVRFLRYRPVLANDALKERIRLHSRQDLGRGVRGLSRLAPGRRAALSPGIRSAFARCGPGFASFLPLEAAKPGPATVPGRQLEGAARGAGRITDTSRRAGALGAPARPQPQGPGRGGG